MTRNNRALYCSINMSLFMCALLSAEAVAAQEQPATVDPIIVTAQKQSRDLQQVPVSVAAVTAETIEAAGVNTLDSVQRLTPGVSMSAIGGAASFTYIRGSGTNVLDAGSDPSIAFFLDEVYLAGTAGLQFELLDVERIEVLKGPQGTLFGRNAAGGAISIITKRPSDVFDAWLTADVGNYGLFAIRGGVTGQIGDSAWSYRLSGAHRERDAYTENPAGLDPGFVDIYAVRGQLMYDANAYTFLLTADYFTSDNGMTNFFPSSVNKSGLLSPEALAALPTDERFYRRYYDVAGYERQDAYSVTARFERELSFAELTAISAYRNSEFDRLQDQDGTLADSFVFGNHERVRTFSQELRLSNSGERWDWIAGLYYYFGKTNRVDISDSGPAFGLAALRNAYGRHEQNLEVESYAAFGQATYELLQDLRVTVGARYSKDQKTSDQRADPAGPTPEFTAHLSPEWSSFDPALIVEYQPTADVMLYGSYRRGYKSGGFQSLPGSQQLASTPYAPEKVNSFELGAKTQFFDDRLRVNIALFDTRVTDQQVLRLPGPGRAIIDNAGETKTHGVDLSISAVLSEYFRVDWNSTYQRARFKHYLSNCAGTPPVCAADFAGNRQLRSPDFQTSVSAEARIPLGASGDVTVRGDYAYQTKTYFDAANTDTSGSYQPAYGVLNGRITYAPPNQNWDVSIFGRNLTGKKYFRNVAISGPTGVGTPGDPMTYGVTLNWRLR